MIVGRFENGRPVVAGHVVVPRLGWHGSLAVSFQDEGGRPIYRYRITVRIGEPEDVSDVLPSLLGQDVLRRWRMIHEPDIGRLEFYVKSSDDVIE